MELDARKLVPLLTENFWKSSEFGSELSNEDLKRRKRCKSQTAANWQVWTLSSLN